MGLHLLQEDATHSFHRKPDAKAAAGRGDKGAIVTKAEPGIGQPGGGGAWVSGPEWWDSRECGSGKGSVR